MVLGIGQVAARDRLASSGLLKNVLEFLLSTEMYTDRHTHTHNYKETVEE